LSARLQQSGNELLALEALARPVLLDHHVGDLVDALVAGKAPPAVEAFTPPADRLALLALAGVHDLVAEVAAKWALHWFAATPS
jgi:hypothetical protein